MAEIKNNELEPTGEESKPKIITKEIVLILSCFIVFFATQLFLLSRVNPNVEVSHKVREYQEQLQLTSDEYKAIENFTIKIDKETISQNKQKDLYFHSVPSFLVWIFMISAFMAISAGLLFPFVETILKTIKELGIHKYQTISLAIALGLFAIVVFVFAHAKEKGFLDSLFKLKPGAELISEFEILLLCPKQTIQIIVGFMFGSAIIGIFGLLLLNVGTTNLMLNIKNLEKEIINISVRMNRFKQNMQFYLYSLSLLVVGSIITSALLRKSVLTILPSNNNYLFPIEFVYLYGLSFSLILAIAYFPIFYNLKNKSKEILMKFYDLQNNFEEKEAELIKKRVVIENSAIDNIKMILSIMAPLFTSFLPNLL